MIVGQTPVSSAKPTIEKREPDSGVKCGFPGNTDAYGLGIRLGVYIQWITSGLTFCFIEKQARSIDGISNCFQIAMFVGLLFITFKQGRDLQASEAYLMLTFSLSGVFATDDTIDFPALRRIDRGDVEAYTSALGSLIQKFIKVALCAYAVWFFFTGMDGMQHPPCSTFGFLVIEVHLYHWVRTVFKIGFVILTFATVAVLGLQVVAEVCKPEVPAPAAEAEADANGNPNTYPNSDSGSYSVAVIPAIGKRHMRGWTGFGIRMFSLSMFILTVELVIRWNHIQGVNQMGSTGQVLPLVVSIGSLIGVLCRSLLQIPSVDSQIPRN